MKTAVVLTTAVSDVSPDLSGDLGCALTLRFLIAHSRIGRSAVRADILIAGFAALDAGRSRHCPGTEFHGDCNTDLLADSKTTDPAIPGTDVSRCYDRLAAAVCDRRAHMGKWGHRHRHADGRSLIPNHRAAPAALLFTDGTADLQTLGSHIAAEQTDVNPRHLAGHRQFKADTHRPIYLIQREIKFQAGASSGRIGAVSGAQLHIAAFPKHHFLGHAIDGDGDIHNLLCRDLVANPKHQMDQIRLQRTVFANGHNIIAKPLVLAHRRVEDRVGQIERYLKRQDPLSRNSRVIDFQITGGSPCLIART